MKRSANDNKTSKQRIQGNSINESAHEFNLQEALLLAFLEMKSSLECSWNHEYFRSLDLLETSLSCELDKRSVRVHFHDNHFKII